MDGVKLYGWYEDEAVSGYAVPFAPRPDGKRLLADVQAGRVSLIVVTKLDRLGRNAYEVLGAVRQIEAAGARLISLKENVDTSTSAGRFFLTVLAGVAEFERDSIVERTDEGVARRLNDTTWMGGHAPYGYRVEGKKRDARLVIEDTLDSASGYSESDAVRLAWRLLVEDDWITDRIALRFLELGIPTRYGGRWTSGSVFHMLTTSTYAGTRTYRSKDGTVHTHAVPAILAPDQLERARATFAAHRFYARTPDVGPDAFVLRGKLRCSECGQLYTTTTGRTGSGKGERRRYYVCSTRDYRSTFVRRAHPEDFPMACIGKGVDAEKAELKIWAQIAAWAANPGEALEELAAQRQQRGKDVAALRAEAERVSEDREALQAERDKVVTLYRTGALTETDLRHQLADLSDKDAALRERADAIAAAARAASEDAEGLDRARAMLQRLHARLDSEPLTLELQREVIGDLVKEIRVLTLDNGMSARGKQKYRAHLDVAFTFDKPSSTECADMGDDVSKRMARVVGTSHARLA